MASYDEWLEPWSDRFYEHQRPLREAFESKNAERAIQAFETYMPAMISIRNEVAQLEVPNYWPTSLFTSLRNMLFGIKDYEMLQTHKDVILKVWGEAITDYQVKYQKMMKKLR